MRTNLSLNTVAARARLLGRGRLATMEWLDSLHYPRLDPARVFPNLGAVRIGGALATQHSEVTCATSVLALANALYDPVLLGYLRAEDVEVDPRDRVASRARTDVAQDRFAGVQGDLHEAIVARRWPGALGTPPWGLAAAMRVPGVAYRHLPINDRDDAILEVLLPAIHRATAAGVPVPLYTGGNLNSPSTAVPRHVVLAIPLPPAPADPDARHRWERSLRIYEPSTGRVYRRTFANLSRRSAPDVALGNWSHLAWVILPEPTTA